MRLLCEQGAPWGPESPAASALHTCSTRKTSGVCSEGSTRCPLSFPSTVIPPNLCGQPAQGDHSVGAIGAWGIETLTIVLAASI